MPVYCSSREDWLCCEIWEHGGRVVKCISRPSGAKWETRHVISFHSRLTRCPRPRDCTARGKGQGGGGAGRRPAAEAGCMSSVTAILPHRCLVSRSLVNAAIARMLENPLRRGGP